ncbi:uncharacterized protein LOC131596136 isoform X1 [Vicia villosa]|uniref:uncharacterized protein LOC131596136 isoform X1 n=1 Tax=Vicia villosa TaxID=3911 RepID=UPI00273B7F31|nr:uncharacterized protein LOC131596136 isoform X1 [Vicia villosa]
MPYCDVGTLISSPTTSSSAVAPADAQLNNDVKIFYRTYGRGPTKVLLIIGLASSYEGWGPQVKGLTGTDVPNDEDDAVWSGGDNEAGGGIEVCAFDNRGVGRSSVPIRKSDYSTKIMAKDAITLLDHLGWKKAHVFGHSMGSMIACKLAAMVPDRVLSLGLLNATGGGFQCFPKLDRRTFSVAYRFLKAKSPEQRAEVDLDTHYSQEFLEEYVGTVKRRTILYQQYVKGISSSGMQSNHGFDGQLSACWNHKMTQTEIEAIKSAGFLVSVIHGRDDIIAQLYYARRLAERFHPMARMVDLHGGHLVSHERPEEVNQALFDLIKASEVKMIPHDWTNLPNALSWWDEKRVLLVKNNQSGSNVTFKYYLIDKLHLCLLYILSLLIMLLEFGRKLVRRIKPVRVGNSAAYIGSQ